MNQSFIGEVSMTFVVELVHHLRSKFQPQFEYLEQTGCRLVIYLRDKSVVFIRMGVKLCLYFGFELFKILIGHNMRYLYQSNKCTNSCFISSSISL